MRFSNLSISVRLVTENATTQKNNIHFIISTKKLENLPYIPF